MQADEVKIILSRQRRVRRSRGFWAGVRSGMRSERRNSRAITGFTFRVGVSLSVKFHSGPHRLLVRSVSKLLVLIYSPVVAFLMRFDGDGIDLGPHPP